MLILIDVKLADGADKKTVLRELDFELKHPGVVSARIVDIGVCSEDGRLEH